MHSRDQSETSLCRFHDAARLGHREGNGWLDTLASSMTGGERMSDLVPAQSMNRGLLHRPSSLGPIEQRRADRQLVRQLTAVEHELAVAIRREDARGQVAQAAMLATAVVSSTEEQLVRMCPLAEPRLRAIGDAQAMGAATAVMSFGRGW